jgi:hypothetical protein
MLTIRRSGGVLLSLGLGLLVACASGCSASSEDDASSSEAAVTEGLHEPQGDERKAIFAAFREVLDADLNGQSVAFNSTNPVGRYQAHGDWASYEGILEGPDGNATPINYSNSIYKDAAEGGYLDGVQRNGHFAAKFLGLAHRGADGAWHVVDLPNEGGKSYAVGPGYDAWRNWASLPPVAKRDVSREFPKDDLHEPQGDERRAILGALHAAIDPQLNGQTCAFNNTSPLGKFLEHDGWAYYEGIIEGPNGNVTPINYTNTIYHEKAGQPGFEGVLRNGNFAAKVTALLQQQADGSWKVSAQEIPSKEGTTTHSAGFSVGTDTTYFGETSYFAYDIYGYGGRGEGGEGEGGRGEGEGDGEGGGH